MSINSQIACINMDDKLHDEWMMYISPRFLTYCAKHPIFIKTTNYTLKTAHHISELIELFRMRHHIFFNETGITDEHNLDLDQFDSICDHLVIRCNKTGDICGTYRMLSSEYTKKFYAQGEFNMDDFLKSPGIKLELGRACIRPDHRNGATIDLLWKGIGEYSKVAKADYIFGCSSIMTVSPVMAKAIYNVMDKNEMISHAFKVKPKAKYKMSFSSVSGEGVFDEKFILGQIPPLLRSYINAGSRVFGKPALDNEFQCIDFLTILNLKEVNPSYDKRYF